MATCTGGSLWGGRKNKAADWRDYIAPKASTDESLMAMVRAASNSSQCLVELTRVVREVDSAPDLESALGVLVCRTREIMRVDVCTVYFTDDDDRCHVIAATDGLSSNVVGNVKCRFGQGLIGRIAESRRPLNLERLPSERDQDFLLQSGEGHYQGFLGVPVVHKARVQGVLLVRQREARRFDDADEALLTTLAAQLGGAIAYAKASGEWCPVCRPQAATPRRIEGSAGAPGLAIGRAAVVIGSTSVNRIPDRLGSDPAAEEIRLREAFRAVREEATTLNTELAGRLAEADRALFSAYGMLLDSPEIMEAALAETGRGNWAPGAVSRAIESYAAHFDAMSDPYLRERAADIRALGDRILRHMRGESNRVTIGQTPTVLIGERLSALDIGQAQGGNLVGIVSGDGSSLSHAAILARALGIPAVVGVSGLPLIHLDGRELAIDGSAGHVHLQLSVSLREEFDRSCEGKRRTDELLEPLRTLDAMTANGERVELFVNAGLSADLDVAVGAGSAGIGLYRSELPFMLFDRLPSELEQQQLYRQALQAMSPLPVTIRTLDVGGDKVLPYLQDPQTSAAFGQRGIRFMLDHPEIFLTQLRAALRANLDLGNLRLLFPMISGLDELEQALRLLEQARDQLLDEGLAVSRPDVGVMIEVPAAIYQVEELARRVDFLSVGTNDLAQFLLATDRNDPQVSVRLDPVHPALLRALKQISDSAQRAGKPVTVCGEIAGDPAMALVLLGMGFNGLSMSPAVLLEVKWAVRSVTTATLRAMAAEALRCESPDGIHRLLGIIRGDIGLEGLISAATNDPKAGRTTPAAAAAAATVS